MFPNKLLKKSALWMKAFLHLSPSSFTHTTAAPLFNRLIWSRLLLFRNVYLTRPRLWITHHRLGNRRKCSRGGSSPSPLPSFFSKMEYCNDTTGVSLGVPLDEGTFCLDYQSLFFGWEFGSDLPSLGKSPSLKVLLFLLYTLGRCWTTEHPFLPLVTDHLLLK